MIFISDRRQEKRYAFPLSTLVHTSSDIELEAPLPVKSWNISQDGISFILPQELLIGKRYKIEIQIKPTISILAQIKVAWIQKQGHRKLLHGGSIFFSSETQSNQLFEFFNSLETRKDNKANERREKQRRENNQTFSKNNRNSDRRFINNIKINQNRTQSNEKFIRLRRVAITGLGVVSPLGLGKESFLKSIKENISGINKIDQFAKDEFSAQSGALISDEDIEKYIENIKKEYPNELPKKLLTRRKTERSTYFALISAFMALKDANLNLSSLNRGNIGVSIGTIMGGLAYAFKEHDTYYSKGIFRMDPYTVAAASPNSSSGEIAAQFNLRGPSTTFSQGCTSGAMAISYGFDQIQKGRLPVMIVGGVDSPFQESTFAAFCRSGMLAPSLNGKPVIPRPFDIERNGIVLGEAGGTLVLEDLEHAIARNAPIYGEILATGNTCDGFDMIRWRWHGSETARAIKMALKDSDKTIEDINLIYAQAAGTYQGDEIELRAFMKVFKDRLNKIPLTNLKSLLGYTQGACAPLELISACLSLQYSLIPGMPGFKKSSYRLNIKPEARKIPSNNVLINCLGFGGKNISIVLSKV